MEYHEMTFAKPHREKKPPKQLKAKTPLKSHYEPISIELKRAVLEVKGSLCFLGFCPVCGGMAEVTEKNDFHHFPHKSQNGKDCIEHLWPCLRECHDFIQTHAWEEKEMFKQMEAAGIPVVWKAKQKGIGYTG